jgi:hypothetical protein
MTDGNGIKPPRFPLVRFRDIKPSDEPFYVVDGILPQEALVVVWGPPKCGKSFFVVDLVMHVTLAWKYRERHVEGGPVLYIACEGERGIYNRLEAFRRHRLAGKAADPPFYLLATSLNLVSECPQLLRYRSPNHRAKVRRHRPRHPEPQYRRLGKSRRRYERLHQRRRLPA